MCVRPGTILQSGPSISALAELAQVQQVRTPRESDSNASIQADLKAFRGDKNELEQVVVINVSSTEAPFAIGDEHQSLEKLNPLLERSSPPILPASSLYAYAALDLGLPYVNFTPSLGNSLPALDELARLRKVPYGGQDGKTGETLLKAVLAPMFAARNLHIMSWIGHNILGGGDGRTLSTPENKSSKVLTKDAILGDLLGYKPQTHVSIEYVESLDDWKTAWDHIHFEGFLGAKMTMQFTWQGCDAILASPLVLDLARVRRCSRTTAPRRSGRDAAPGLFLQEPHRRRRARFLQTIGVAARLRRESEFPVVTSSAGNLKLAFSTNAYLKFSFAEAVRRLAAIGYTGVEIMADVPHAWPAYMLPEQKQAIRAALADNNLAISNINAFMMHAVSDHRQHFWHPSWIEPDPHYRQVRILHTKRALTLAKELGARCITTEPGGPVEPGASWSAALKLFVEMIKPVAEHAEKEGVLLLVEPEPGLLIETADQFDEFMTHIDSPAIGLNFDIGHHYCVKDDPALTIERLAKFIRHVHLEDIAATRVHHHLIPGEGAIDFAATLKSIKKIGYTGWITIELYPYVDDPDVAANGESEDFEDCVEDAQTGAVESQTNVFRQNFAFYFRTIARKGTEKTIRLRLRKHKSVSLRRTSISTKQRCRQFALSEPVVSLSHRQEIRH